MQTVLGELRVNPREQCDCLNPQRVGDPQHGAIVRRQRQSLLRRLGDDPQVGVIALRTRETQLVKEPPSFNETARFVISSGEPKTAVLARKARSAGTS